MTKSELIQAIDTSYCETLEELNSSKVLQEKLAEFVDENGKVPSVSIPAFCIFESMAINKTFISKLLEKLFEIED